MENMKKLFYGNMYGKKMWPTARTYMPQKHQMWMDEVFEYSSDVKPWLEEHHNLLWARSKFSCHSKCEYINNNLAESWNAWIKDLKDLLIDALADAIRERTLILFEKRRISTALNGVILPAVIHQLNAASKGLDHLKVTKGDPYQTEVTEVHNDEELTRHVVYLDKCTCTCREWQAAYASSIPNITDKKQWPQVEKEFKLLPPVSKKRKVGRQRKNRIPSTLEKSKGKATRQIKCPECGFFGHRKGSARCELTGTKKGKRNQKTTTKVGRKKAKCVSDEQVSTPRTRVAAPREEATETQGQPSQTSSPGPVTRRRLAFEIGQNTQVTPATVEPPRKLTPRKKLANKKKSATPYRLLN